MRKLRVTVLICFACALGWSYGATCYFKTGFSADIGIKQIDRSNAILTGADKTTGFSVDALKRIPGLVGTPNLGIMGEIPKSINFTLDDLGAPFGRVLHFMVYSNENPASMGATRASYSFIYAKDNRAGFKQAYVKFKMKLSVTCQEAMTKAERGWLQLIEYKTYDEKSSGKCTMELQLAANGSGYHPWVRLRSFDTHTKINTLWRVDNPQFDFPFGQWITVEVFLKYDHAGSGRFLYAINGQKVFDIRDKEFVYLDKTGKSYPLWVLWFFKLYQDRTFIDWMRQHGTPCEAWYDDLEYWDDFPSSSPLK